ncbi:MAG: septation protein SepH [Marmoricola sp.]
MSRSLRTATSPPDSANTKMPSRSRTASSGWESNTVPRSAQQAGGTSRLAAKAEEGVWEQIGATMRDLTPVRLTGGGTLVVLVDADGVEYVLPVDALLRETLGQALSGSGPGLAEQRETPAAQPLGIRRKESTMESSLRPRDIQARIRAGESPEDVAAVAGTPVERVMIFATPVLAERAHVAHGALTASVRRKSADPASVVRTLGPSAATRLREEGVDPESVEWDAWRRDDGRWTLVAAYHHDSEQRVARFSFDQPGHFVMADDDEGRWLVGDGQFPSRADKEQAREHKLAPVPRYEEQLPLGDDAIELVRETPESESDETGPTGDLQATVAAVRARRAAAPVPEPEEVTGDADWIATPDPHEGPVLPLTTQEPHLAHIDHSADDQAHDQGVIPGLDPARPVHVDQTEDEADDPETQLPKRAVRKARGRASVPSWDEIMFGGGRGD